MPRIISNQLVILGYASPAYYIWYCVRDRTQFICHNSDNAELKIKIIDWKRMHGIIIGRVLKAAWFQIKYLVWLDNSQSQPVLGLVGNSLKKTERKKKPKDRCRPLGKWKKPWMCLRKINISILWPFEWHITDIGQFFRVSPDESFQFRWKNQLMGRRDNFLPWFPSDEGLFSVDFRDIVQLAFQLFFN